MENGEILRNGEVKKRNVVQQWSDARMCRVGDCREPSLHTVR